LSTEVGFAHKFPPHYISPLWPTGAILFSVLVVTPVRHWWAYTLAAYFTSVINDARADFPLSAILFIVAGITEIWIVAAGVRRYADGLRAFDSLRSLIVYIVIAVFLAPFTSAFVAAFAGGTERYWFYWRVWFLSEALAFLTLAPAILTGIAGARIALGKVSAARFLEGCLLGCGLFAASVYVFARPTAGDEIDPARVYLPLPFLLWAAVRFGPLGVNSALLVVACLSISGAVHGRGPFIMGTPAESMLSLQLFLVVIALPLMFLAALIEERREKTNVLSESEARFRTLADTAPILIWMSGPDRLCTFFNQGWLQFTGRAAEQELGNDWMEGIHADDRDGCLRTYVNAFDARKEFAMEYRLRRSDGEYRWVLDKGVPRLARDGTFLGYIDCADDITERRKAEEELRESHRELRALTGRLLQAQESERRRIAREMHDDWTQRLAVLGIDVAMLEQQLGAPDKARPLLHSIQGKLMRLTEDVHALSRQLHPAILDDLGLVEALRSECAAFSEREGIEVSYCPEGVPEFLPKDVALCVYRIAQEALRNIAKHASVDKARVALTATDQELLLRVQDAGAGFDATGVPSRPGLGLSSMQERARLVHAALSVTSEPGLGTTVLVRVPLGGVPHEQAARVAGR
ncbi:MAG TPA: MASE1 domain-containing protein, partial [Fimbriiglobus sp.]|nr:MASE1 domain-containing protein [Fimbriiglobus sp.]